MYTLVIVDDEKELLEGLSHYFPWESIGFSVAASFPVNGFSHLLPNQLPSYFRDYRHFTSDFVVFPASPAG